MDYTESIEKTKVFISEHLYDELTAENIASNAGYSVFHFCRIFKEETGKSLMSYVREKRLELAESDIEKVNPPLRLPLNTVLKPKADLQELTNGNSAKDPQKE